MNCDWMVTFPPALPLLLAAPGIAWSWADLGDKIVSEIAF